jgi:hypothetical protein
MPDHKEANPENSRRWSRQNFRRYSRERCVQKPQPGARPFRPMASDGQVTGFVPDNLGSTRRTWLAIASTVCGAFFKIQTGVVLAGMSDGEYIMATSLNEVARQNQLAANALSAVCSKTSETIRRMFQPRQFQASPSTQMAMMQDSILMTQSMLHELKAKDFNLY